MRKVLLAVDGSEHSDQAARYVVEFVKEHGTVEIHLANVEPEPVGWQTLGLEQEAIQAHLAALGRSSVKSAQAILDNAGLPYHTHFRQGDAASALVSLAKKAGCDTVIMGTRGLNAISGMALGSVTTKVLHLSEIPVICVK